MRQLVWQQHAAVGALVLFVCVCVWVFCLCVGLNSCACAFKNQKNNNILQGRFKMEQLRYGYGDFNSSTTSQRPAFIYWKLQDQQCSTIGDKHRWVVDGYQFSMVVRWLWNDRSQLPSTTKPRSQPVWALPFRYPWVVFLGSERRSFRPTLAMYETQDSDPSVSKQNIEDLDDFFPDFWWFFKENNIRKSLRYVYTGNKPVVKKTVENCWSKCSGTVQTVPLLYTVIQNIPIKIGIPKPIKVWPVGFLWFKKKVDVLWRSEKGHDQTMQLTFKDARNYRAVPQWLVRFPVVGMYQSLRAISRLQKPVL